jgi:hypothetical protein
MDGVGGIAGRETRLEPNRAHELDPLSAVIQALQVARQAIVVDPEFWIGYYSLMLTIDPK